MYISATNQTKLTFPLQIRRRLTPWPWNKGRSAIHRPPLGSALKSLAVPRSDFLPLPPGQPLRENILCSPCVCPEIPNPHLYLPGRLYGQWPGTAADSAPYEKRPPCRPCADPAPPPW